MHLKNFEFCSALKFELRFCNALKSFTRKIVKLFVPTSSTPKRVKLKLFMKSPIEEVWDE